MDCRSIFGLRAIARMLSAENFFKDDPSLEYGVEDKIYLRSN